MIECVQTWHYGCQSSVQKIQWIIFHCLHSTHKNSFRNCIRPSGGCHAVAGGYSNVPAAGTCGKLLDSGGSEHLLNNIPKSGLGTCFFQKKIRFAFCYLIPMSCKYFLGSCNLFLSDTKWDVLSIMSQSSHQLLWALDDESCCNQFARYR